ncbi:I78 family peptidase inhibitor [Sphingomonas corticis]|jgi:hypothetical protein|nr:I78 family peptidase inhibitor [Sphingomonas corticis]
MAWPAEAMVVTASVLQAAAPFGEPAAAAAAPTPCLAAVAQAVSARDGGAPPSLAIGTVLSARDRDRLAAVGPATIRLLAPGDMATMDHRPGRLNLELDPHGRILRHRCG